ncbi:MAG: hypothetical protein IJE97_07200, partial [Thermoguttaceae bacterium]|nr:hypothetical protein [Thermoguttaceae bacterium]
MTNRRNFSKRVSILSALIFSTGAAAFAWGAIPATDWEDSAVESASIYEVDAYDGEEAAFEEPVLAEETSNEAEASATAETSEGNAGYSLHVHGAETRETHVKHVEEASAFRVLLDKLELGATITAVGQQSD